MCPEKVVTKRVDRRGVSHTVIADGRGQTFAIRQDEARKILGISYWTLREHTAEEALPILNMHEYDDQELLWIAVATRQVSIRPTDDLSQTELYRRVGKNGSVSALLDIPWEVAEQAMKEFSQSTAPDIASNT